MDDTTRMLIEQQSGPDRPRWTRLRAAVAAGAAAALTAAGLGALVGPAQADIGGVVWGAGRVVSVQGYTLHIMQYVDNQGRAWYCPQPQLPSPTDVTGAMTQAAAGYVNAQGEALDAATMQTVSALLWKYGQTDDDDQAAAVLLATRSLLGLTATPIEGTTTPVSWALWDPASLGSAIADRLGLRHRVTQMIAWAQANRNPGWDGSGTLASAPGQGAQVAPGGDWTLTAALPGLGAGRAVVFTLTSPDGSTTQRTASTDPDGTAALVTTVPAVPQGVWSASAALAEPVPPQWATQQPAPGLQSLLLGGGEPSTWSSQNSVTVKGGKFTPEVATKPAKSLVMPGATNTDTVSGTCHPGDTVAGVVRLYDGFASERDALDADVAQLTPAGTGTFSTVCPDSGRFTTTSTPVKATKVGTAFFYESLTATDLSQAVVQSPQGRATELFTVALPRLDTTLSAALMSGDVDLSDTLVVRGLLSDNPELRVAFTGRIVGPVWPRSGACPPAGDASYAAAPLVSRIDAVLDNSTIGADGEATLARVGQAHLPAAAPGCYSAAVRMEVTLDDALVGSDQSVGVVAVVESAAGTPSETGVVVQPAIGTRIEAPDGPVPGGTVSDTVAFSGLVPTDDLVYRWHADYGVAPVGVDGACDWSAVTTLDSSDQVLDHAAIGPDGSATVTGVLPQSIPTTGCVGYRESLDVVWQGKTVAQVDHPWGSQGQSLLVEEPAAPAPQPAESVPLEAPPSQPPTVETPVVVVGLSAPTGGTPATPVGAGWTAGALLVAVAAAGWALRRARVANG